MEISQLTIYTDGGARGNPGPAAVGVVINDGGGSAKRYKEYIGETTNNFAEYSAVVYALKKAKQLLGKERARRTRIEIYGDSELLYKQVRGEYKIMEPSLQPFFIEIWNLKQDFADVHFNLVPRERNREADALVNEALDEKEGVS